VARVRRGKPDPLTSLVLTLPIFVTYHLGILFIDKRNGVDWVTELTLRLVHSSVPAYVVVTASLALGLAGAVWLLRRAGTLQPRAFLPIVIESALWAGFMLVALGWATARLAPWLKVGRGLPLGPLEKLVMAAGAGFHEELMFRVILLSGGALLLRRVFGAGATRAWLWATLLSSLTFAFVHHLGPYGEPISAMALCFRTLAGVYLALVYGARGFAVAVHTHAFYDLLVFYLL
jgi:hypothetical protein